MVRGALIVMAVVLLACLANVQARNYVRKASDETRRWGPMWNARSSSSSHDQDRSPPSEVADAVLHQIARFGSSPIPYTKQFYITFGPYYAENPLSIRDKPSVRQMDEIDVSKMPMGGR